MSKSKKNKSVRELEHELKHRGNPLGKSEIALGVVSGAVIGAMAGPPGIAVGVALGAAAGAIGAAASAVDDAKREETETELDETIGVSGGDLGAPNLKHPPSKRGAFSAASSGATAGGSVVPAEGPTPSGESED